MPSMAAVQMATQALLGALANTIDPFLQRKYTMDSSVL